MSNLDSFHPFRQSVNHKDSSSSSSQNSTEPQNNNANQDEKEYSPFFSWKTKLRLLIFAMAGSVLMYVLSSAIESFDLPNTSEAVKKNKESESTQIPDQVFDKNDLNERGREVSHARKKAGIFASIFCKGGKRSRFCDN